jgi:hypothetical protein
MWADDRQAFETRDLVKDRDAYYYSQVWRDLETSEVTWEKHGRLGDPALSGRASYRPTSPRGAARA